MVSLFSDALTHAWGVVLFQNGHKLVSRDYWPSDPSTDVNLLELRALLNALVSFKGHLPNSRIDVHIDNKVLKSALDNDACRNSAINEVVKEICRYSRDQNLSIQTFYVPLSRNSADEPSRECSDLDCMLSVGAWLSLECLFTPHSFDLMSLDSNCQKPPPDPLGSAFSLIPYRLDTTFTCFHLSFFLDLFFAMLSTKCFMALSHSLFRIFDQGHSVGRPSRPSQSIDFFWARRVLVRSYFSLASILKNGSFVLCSGTSGRSDVSTSKCFCLTVPLLPRFLDLGRLPGDVPHVYTLMTLMPTFARLVVCGHALKNLLSLPRLLTMWGLLNVSKSLTMCSKRSLTRGQPLSKNF